MDYSLRPLFLTYFFIQILFPIRRGRLVNFNNAAAAIQYQQRYYKIQKVEVFLNFLYSFFNDTNKAGIENFKIKVI